MSKCSVQLLLVIIGVSFLSCSKENTEAFDTEVVRRWSIPVTAKNILSASAGAADTGTVNFQLFSDNSIRYELTVDHVNTVNQVLSGAQLRVGDPVTNGPVILDLTPTSKFAQTIGSVTSAYGVVTGLRQTLVDSLMNPDTHLYFELNSVQFPSGFARGQLNERIVFAADINLRGSEEVPPVNTTASGINWLRITADRKLYSRITIINNEGNDPFTMAHIHRAAIGQNGPIIIGLAASPADFNVSKKFDLDPATVGTIINDSRLYVNAHSMLFPAGKLRGQIRN